MIIPRLLPALLLLGALTPLAAQSAESPDREALHRSSDWLTVSPHLPDPQTGAPADLETAADVLRARRLPDDALDYYRYALARGGDRGALLNRIGITELELRRPTAARAAFEQALAADQRSPEGWNNLGAAQFMLGDYISAVSDYRRAVRLDKRNAVFHANLGTALFERKDYEGARSQFQTAVKLDPGVLDRSGSSGIQARILSAQDRGRFCFEMAKIAAAAHQDEAVLQWLARATEAGFDVRNEVANSRDLTPYRHDARLLLILSNARALRSRQLAATPAPPLPADAPARD